MPAGDDALINLLVIAKLLGLVAALLGLREAGRLARVAGLGPGTTGAALCLIASSTPYAAWAVGALETPFVAWLATMLIAGAAEIAQINNSSDDASGSAATLRAGFAGAGLVMFRVDGFVIPVIVIIALAIGRVPWRTLLRVLAPPLVMLMVLFGFRQLYYGHWFPTPVSAKVDIGASIARIGDTLSHYTRPFSLLFGGWPVVASALALGLLHPDGAVAHGNASRIVPSILESSEAVDKNRASFLWPYVTHDPAHARSPFVM